MTLLLIYCMSAVCQQFVFELKEEAILLRVIVGIVSGGKVPAVNSALVNSRLRTGKVRPKRG